MIQVRSESDADDGLSSESDCSDGGLSDVNCGDSSAGTPSEDFVVMARAAINGKSTLTRQTALVGQKREPAMRHRTATVTEHLILLIIWMGSFWHGQAEQTKGLQPFGDKGSSSLSRKTIHGVRRSIQISFCHKKGT